MQTNGHRVSFAIRSALSCLVPVLAGWLLPGCSTARYVPSTEPFALSGPAVLTVQDIQAGETRSLAVEAVRTHGDTVFASGSHEEKDVRFRRAEVRHLTTRSAMRGAWHGAAVGLLSGAMLGFGIGSIIGEHEGDCRDDDPDDLESGGFNPCISSPQLYGFAGSLVGALGGMVAGGVAGAVVGAKTEYVFKDTIPAAPQQGRPARDPARGQR